MLTVPSDPPTALEDRLAVLLAEVVETESVPGGAHFFDDLGADSMTMARFCARVRKQPGLPPISMKEIYRNPTLEALSAALVSAAAEPMSETRPAVPDGTASLVRAAPFRATSARYWGCGIAQLGLALAYTWLGVLIIGTAGRWALAAEGAAATYVRAVLAGAVVLGLACLIPIAAKWALVGRWREREIPVWGLAYLRFWTVKTLLRGSPIPFTAGTPIYNVFLRALGAEVGRGALILSRRLPLVTDLLTVGPGAVVRRNALLNGYHAQGGRIRTGRVTIGAGAHVGEATVLGLGVTIGDGAWIGHASSVQDGEQVPAGQRRDGFGAQRADAVTDTEVEPRPTGWRPLLYTLGQVGMAVLVFMPVAAASSVLLVTFVESRTDVFTGSLGAWQTYASALALGAVLYLGFLVVSFLLGVSLPRVLQRMLVPGRTYPVYGARYWAQRSIERRTNQRSFLHLLGDSSYVVPYLQAMGYRMPDLVQTGSNFGCAVAHDNPFLTTVGSGTMVADGLSVINVDYSGSSFRLSPATVGARSFLGNLIVYPPQATVGEDCLLATKVMVPMEGEVSTGVGLLGAPAFEIPRTVRRDAELAHLAQGENLRRGLAAKNRYNLRTIGVYAATTSLLIAELTLLSNVAYALRPALGPLGFALGMLVGTAAWVTHLAVAVHACTRFRPLQPLYCSIYDRRFWRHERYWKFAQQPRALDGTPFKILVWRLYGVRIGRRVFDDGCTIVETSLTTVGDDCTLNMGSIVQGHSQENGTFKSDRIVIGAGCTIGTASLVHYGATLGDGVDLAPDSFLMKGEDAPAHTHWAGNPAREVS